MMAKTFYKKRLFLLMSAAGIIGFNQSALASAFQLWEQDGATVGNYHAGVAAEAPDASTAFYNPAGLVRIKNQQVVFGGDPVITDFRYNGSVKVSNEDGPFVANDEVVVQGGGFNFVPFGHYAAPINNNLVFGLSAVVPFGLKTDYGNTTDAKYIATLTSVTVYDISPSFGLAFNDKISVGAGLDIEHIKGEFNQYAAGPLGPGQDTLSNNSGSGNAYGYHLGALLQWSDQTRFGLSYHSQVVHHLKGNSRFSGPLANDADGGIQGNNLLETTTTLPPMTSLTAFHSFPDSGWDIMGTITYIQWSTFKQLILKNVAGVIDNKSQNMPVSIYQGYHNSWNYTVGTNYHLNEQWMLKSGVGFDQSPSSDRWRNLQLPDSNRIAAAIGVHLQATKTMAFDIGWTHLFVINTRINNRVQTVGDETDTTNGSISAAADVYGLQMKWDIV